MGGAAEDAARALSRGDLIRAYDLAASAIAAGDGSTRLRHQQVLALARMGDTDRASALFRHYRLDRSPDPHERAVGARLLKDSALALPPGEERRRALEQAFEAYHAIYSESGDPFPGINAATLALLAGRDDEARAIAGALLAGCGRGADYYAAVTAAEALLVLGRIGEGVEAVESKEVADCRDQGARSTSLRQLRMVAERVGAGGPERARIEAALMPPRTAHYCGHIFAADEQAERRLTAEIGRALDEEKVGYAYGALAAGSDILFAEAALEQDVELHLLLPFEEEDFIAHSVALAGERWLGRYRACREAAASFEFASEMPYFGDPAQFAYASRIAMGRARLRAQNLCSEAVQIALWDGKAAQGPAGTGADVAAWRAQGGRSRIVDPGPVDRDLLRPAVPPAGDYERALAAIIFTDFAGFSTLKESALPAFWSGIMGRVAETLAAHEEELESRNSWGDALYAVCRGPAGAAALALDLQERLAGFDYGALGLGREAGMRVSAHCGPAFRAIDPITGRPTFYGMEVSKTARIEPVTPPGAVFATEPLAALLALEAADRFACRYVGRIPLAKNYGEYPMYRLTRASPAR